jgi:hypothetical protein
MLVNELFNSNSEPIIEGVLDNPDQPDSAVASAIIRRILLQRTDLLAKYGPDQVGQAVDDVADFVGDTDEIGSSDVSGWVNMVEEILASMDQGVAEGNYDRDDYYNARQGREYGKGLTATGYGGDGSKTRRDDIFKGQSKRLPADPFARTSGAVPKTGTGRIHSNALPGEMDEGLGSKLAGLGLAGAMALGSAGTQARVSGDQDPNINRFTGKPVATQQSTDVAPTPASQSFSKEYLQRAADPARTGRYMISVEKARELLSNMQEGDISQLEKDVAAAPVEPIANMEAQEKIGGRHDADDFDDMVSRLKKLAGAGPMKTVWDPDRRVYRNMPTAVQPPQQPKK